MLPYRTFNKLHNKHLELVKEEIKINPSYVDYNIISSPSKYIDNENDYIIYFNTEGIRYVLMVLYFPINEIETYHIAFTTRDQYDEYLSKYDEIKSENNNITEYQFIQLNKIITRETNYNHIYPIFKNISYILFDIHKRYLIDTKFSLIETEDKKKINFYRNIIKSSFDNIEEFEIEMNSDQYYIYKINI